MPETVERARGTAMGAAVMAGFGTVWLAVGLLAMGTSGWLVLAVLCLLLGVVWWLVASRLRGLPVEMVPSNHRPSGEAFAAVNVGEWLAILTAVNVLHWLHREIWQAPAILLIVGLHFLPLARIFRTRSHVVTGLALIVWALASPLVAEPMRVQAVCLGAAVILWISAARALLVAQRMGSGVELGNPGLRA